MPYNGREYPACESHNIVAWEFNPEGCSRACECRDCGATWDEVYKLVGCDNLQVPK